MLDIEKIETQIQEATDYALNLIKKVAPYNVKALTEVVYHLPRPYKKSGVHAVFGKDEVQLFYMKHTQTSFEIHFSEEVEKALFELAFKKAATLKKKATTKKTNAKTS